MNKHFTPTKEQLEKLAKVAKVDYRDSDFFVCWEIRTDTNSWQEWTPYINRDQIALIIEGLDYKQEMAYDDIMGKMWLDTYRILFGQIVHPSISCEKLLEIL